MTKRFMVGLGVLISGCVPGIVRGDLASDLVEGCHELRTSDPCECPPSAMRDEFCPRLANRDAGIGECTE